MPGPEGCSVRRDANPRRSRAIADWNQFDALVPYTKNIHEMSPDYVAEDVELQCIDFGPATPEASPPHAGGTTISQRTRHRSSYLRRVLQVLTFLRGPNRWVIKCPQHGAARHAVPRVSRCDRDHASRSDRLIQSRSSASSISRISRKVIRADEIATYWVDRYERLLKA